MGGGEKLVDGVISLQLFTTPGPSLSFLSPKKNSFLKFPKEQTRASLSSLALEWKDSSYKLG